MDRDYLMQHGELDGRVDTALRATLPNWRRDSDTAGVLDVSNAVLSQDRDYALTYIEHQCDGLCGSGGLHLLKRKGASWSVVKSLRLWVS
ncbi:MAG: hypothetical protein H0T88_09420 [Lysobacter sp.]|nr:hypothetical protein [Lysobacter sp.]